MTATTGYLLLGVNERTATYAPASLTTDVASKLDTTTGPVSKSSQFGLGRRCFKLDETGMLTFPFTGDRVVVPYTRASGRAKFTITLDQDPSQSIRISVEAKVTERGTVANWLAESTRPWWRTTPPQRCGAVFT